MTREQARKLAHKLLGKWADKCVELSTETDEEAHTLLCDTVTGNVLSGAASLETLLAGPSRPPGW